MRKKRMALLLAVCMCTLLFFPVKASEEEELEQIILEYEKYNALFSAIEDIDDAEDNGFRIIEEQSFPVLLESFLDGETEVHFVPIMYEKYNRLGILITDSRGRVLYKTNQLETNNRWLGQMQQPTREIAAVSFQDLDLDGLTDIILITDCADGEGEETESIYKVGDVLFQKEGGFYRDWRISDKINRFNMNKSAKFIASYVRDGNSTEILYTAATLDELVENGFQIVQEQCYYRSFEKQGFLQVVPGVIRMAEYNIFMIYLVNSQGYIEWSFQPMGDYDNLYALKGMTCRDMDGDGMKDIVVLGRYSYTNLDGELTVDTRCSIYYQRTDGFAEDREFEDYYQCTTEDTVSGLVDKIRAYWGWTVEND